MKLKKPYLLAPVILAIISFNIVFAAVDDTCLDYMRSRGMMDGWGGGYGMMNWDGSGGGWGILTMIFAIALWVIFWAIVIVAVAALARWLHMKIFRGELMILGKKETAEDVLKMRYVKGEITKEHYETMKKEIAK